MMAASCGKKINPFSVTFKSTRTASDFYTYNHAVELRTGIYQDALWVWIRVTVRRVSNYAVGEAVQLRTPCGTTNFLRYGNASNAVAGSVGCTAAICLGQPASLTTITYSGVASGDFATKTARV